MKKRNFNSISKLDSQKAKVIKKCCNEEFKSFDKNKKVIRFACSKVKFKTESPNKKNQKYQTGIIVYQIAFKTIIDNVQDRFHELDCGHT